MHLPVLLLMFAVLLADSGIAGTAPPSGGWRWAPLAVAVLPSLAGILVECILVPRDLRSAARGSIRSIERSARRLRCLQWLVVASSITALLVFGLLGLLRDLLGDLVLLDEFLSILPGLLMLCLLWRLHWPIERMIRESLAIRRLDQGLPVHPTPSAGAYVLSQVRAHLLVLLVPASIVLAAVETGRVLVATVLPLDAPAWSGDVLVGSLALMALVVSPLGVLFAIRAESLPRGPARDRLEAILFRARVRVADIRIWPTAGSILNGAVIGFVPRFRYVLLTDALVETLPEPELQAVMAHEVGHLRHRHLPWTAAVLVAQVWLYATLVEWAYPALHPWLLGTGVDPIDLATSIDGIATTVVMVAAGIGFGWISRRFELQADAHSAAVLSGNAPVIGPAGAGAMAGALETVALVNGLDPGRSTWRHGSIRWRQRRLHRLIGLRTDRLPIDRVVRAFKLLTALVLLLLAARLVGSAPLAPVPPETDTASREGSISSRSIRHPTCEQRST